MTTLSPDALGGIIDLLAGSACIVVSAAVEPSKSKYVTFLKYVAGAEIFGSNRQCHHHQSCRYDSDESVA
jgi:hypothetical protein